MPPAVLSDAAALACVAALKGGAKGCAAPNAHAPAGVNGSAHRRVVGACTYTWIESERAGQRRGDE